MFSKFKYPIVLFLTGFILLLVALMLRFLQWPGAQFMAWGIIIVQVISITWLMSIVIKFKYLPVLFLVSFILFLTGLALKIMHWPYAQAVMVIMILVMIIAVAWLIVTIVKEKKPV
jgi:hypothetical protein